ncbi:MULTISPECIES: hypothetical protein [unclassified Actinomyces]|uniref:hypothetical protein n=1 Tax=unclassified Actinomyces TaxID=2609248 RepID=UPI00131A5C2D|nr:MULTISPECIES: hypothetical protein [unclassified Actinomyces]
MTTSFLTYLGQCGAQTGQKLHGAYRADLFSGHTEHYRTDLVSAYSGVAARQAVGDDSFTYGGWRLLE